MFKATLMLWLASAAMAEDLLPLQFIREVRTAVYESLHFGASAGGVRDRRPRQARFPRRGGARAEAAKVHTGCEVFTCFQGRMSFRLQSNELVFQVSAMPSFVVPPGVRFNDCLFSEPVQLAAWRLPSCAGIVAVLARNPQWAPKPLQPLYFGEFGNDAGSRTSLPLNATRDLQVSVLPMPFSTAAQRRALCNELIAAHNPAWQANGTMVSAAALARKVDELEARQQEQSRQILALLAHLGKLFEPEAPRPRRPIGFLSEPAPAAAAQGY